MSLVFKKRANSIKRAGVTIEVMLAAALALIVLFMVLGLFSNNLKKMFESGSIKNMFTNNQSTATFDKDYGYRVDNGTVADPNAVLVQTPEKQLQGIHDDAVQKIAELAAINPLSTQQKLDLAYYLTVLAQSVPGKSQMDVLGGPVIGKDGKTVQPGASQEYSLTYQSLAYRNGRIGFNFTPDSNAAGMPPYTTAVASAPKPILWANPNAVAAINASSAAQTRLNVIAGIDKAFGK